MEEYKMAGPNTKAKKSSNKAPLKIPNNYPFKCLGIVEDSIVTLCNNERQKIGAKPLKPDTSLRILARYRSNEMLQYDYFDHKSPITGYKAADLAKKCHYYYRMFGENIYYCKGYYMYQITAQQIVKAWMNSPGHKENILKKEYTKIGVGVIFSSKENICEATQLFSC
jgi:uncharacterized protein YkwD